MIALTSLSPAPARREAQLGALVSQGPTSDGALAYVFRRGTVRVADGNIQMIEISLPEPLRRSEALAVLGPGSVFGEMALLDEAPRSADARVHERCRLLALPKDAFEDLLFLHKELAYEVLWSVVRMLTQRLRDANDKLTFLSFTGKFE